MDVLISCSKEATEMAKDVLLSNKKLKRPVLVFIEREAWESLESTDEVDTVNEAEGGRLERFKEKEVVFCWYESDEREMLKELSKYWKSVLGGDSVRAVTIPGLVSKFWLARRIADKACDYESVLQYFRRLPIVPKKSFPLPGRDDLLYDPATMLKALEVIRQSSRSAKAVLAAKAGIEEIKAVWDGEEEA